MVFFAIPLLVHLIQLVFTAAIIALSYADSSFLSFNPNNTAAYVLWQYVPLTTVVCMGFFWETI